MHTSLRDQVVFLETAANFVSQPGRRQANDFFAVFFFFYLGGIT